MVRFNRNCPARDGTAHRAQKATRTAAATMETRDVRLGPKRSQRKPPAVFPAKTQKVRARVRAAPSFQGKLTAQPPTARTATARASSSGTARLT